MEAGRPAGAEELLVGPGKLIAVSAEAGLGLVPDTRLGRDWRDRLGEINQDMAAAADLVILAVAGLPLVLKGRMP
jgi:adenosyl cobinamide kinase/adenosyl cobinamide phosphate guanylyltransferase